MFDIKTVRTIKQFTKGVIALLMIVIVSIAGFFSLSSASQIFFGNPFYWMPPAAALFVGYAIWDWAKFKVEMQIRNEEHLVNTLSKKHES